MNTRNEQAEAFATLAASIVSNRAVMEGACAEGVYHAQCVGPVEQFRGEYVRLRDYIAKVQKRLPLVWELACKNALVRFNAIPMEPKWADEIHNVVVTEGKNSALTQFMKGSSYTATMFLGLIESTGYGFAGAQGSGVAATNLASSITAVGGASPANGWNEATTSQCAARGTPSFGTASAGALALGSAVAFSMLATCTIKGCFMMCRSAAATAAVATTGSTAGAIYSAGLFTGGDKACANGDTLSVSYTASL